MKFKIQVPFIFKPLDSVPGSALSAGYNQMHRHWYKVYPAYPSMIQIADKYTARSKIFIIRTPEKPELKITRSRH